MVRILTLICLALLLPVQVFANTPASDALPEVRATLDKVIEINKQYIGDQNKKLRREKLRETLNERFDFEEMARRSLGPEWTKRSAEERTEFVKVFSDLLARTYLSRVETVSQETVQIVSERAEFPRSLVKTTVTASNEKFPLDYKLIHRDGGWKVYDVVIENIGLVANYRNEFSGIIRKEGFDGLLTKLREKVAA
ncbi:MAG: ABC transporter substrate-binding protein [Bdellovibrionota bacterium]|nr:MAG: ABC transporter substrate-binding protein [Bdellovibrionota bacterium]